MIRVGTSYPNSVKVFETLPQQTQRIVSRGRRSTYADKARDFLTQYCYAFELEQLWRSMIWRTHAMNIHTPCTEKVRRTEYLVPDFPSTASTTAYLAIIYGLKISKIADIQFNCFVLSRNRALSNAHRWDLSVRDF